MQEEFFLQFFFNEWFVYNLHSRFLATYPNVFQHQTKKALMHNGYSTYENQNFKTHFFEIGA